MFLLNERQTTATSVFSLAREMGMQEEKGEIVQKKDMMKKIEIS